MNKERMATPIFVFGGLGFLLGVGMTVAGFWLSNSTDEDSSENAIPQFISDLSLNYHLIEDGTLRMNGKNNLFLEFLKNNVQKSVFIDVAIAGSFAMHYERPCDESDDGWENVLEYDEANEKQFGIIMPLFDNRAESGLSFVPAKDEPGERGWVETRIEDTNKFSDWNICSTNLLIEDSSSVYTVGGGTGLYNINFSGFFIVNYRQSGWKGSRDLYQLSPDDNVPFDVRQSVKIK